MTKLHGRRRIWMSTAEFAALVGEKPDTVRHRCYRGTYKCKRVGGRLRVWAGHVEGRGVR